MKGNCEICATEIEIQICCNGFQCGCMGLPVYPPVCSNECEIKLKAKIQEQSKKSRASFNPK